jgi:hypothetical protein
MSNIIVASKFHPQKIMSQSGGSDFSTSSASASNLEWNTVSSSATVTTWPWLAAACHNVACDKARPTAPAE